MVSCRSCHVDSATIQTNREWKRLSMLEDLKNPITKYQQALVRFWFCKAENGLIKLDSFYHYLPKNEELIEQLASLRKQKYAHM